MCLIETKILPTDDSSVCFTSIEKKERQSRGWAVLADPTPFLPLVEDTPFPENVSRLATPRVSRPSILAPSDEPETQDLIDVWRWFQRTMGKLPRTSVLVATVTIPLATALPDPSFWSWDLPSEVQVAVPSKRANRRDDTFVVTLQARPSSDFSSALDLVISLLVADDLKHLEGGLS